MHPRLLLLVAACTCAPAAFAHHDAATVAGAAQRDAVVTAPKDAAARLFFSDRPLITQSGDHVAFYSDVLRDKVVLISFVFTQCTDICPTQSSKLSEVQALLETDADPRINLVSISVDPERDTPAELARYASRFDAGSRWIFLTGARENVHDVLRRLGQLTATPAAHTSLFIAGNARTGRWMKLHPDLAPATIADHLRTLAGRSEASSSNRQE